MWDRGVVGDRDRPSAGCEFWPDHPGSPMEQLNIVIPWKAMDEEWISMDKSQRNWLEIDSEWFRIWTSTAYSNCYCLYHRISPMSEDRGFASPRGLRESITGSLDGRPVAQHGCHLMSPAHPLEFSLWPAGCQLGRWIQLSWATSSLVMH